MKRGLFSFTAAIALCSAASVALAGARGEAEDPVELPAQSPPVRAVRPEPEPVVADPIRKWFGFATDSETSRGLWIEAGSLYGEAEASGFEDEFVSTFLRVAYGQEMWEAGVEGVYDYVNFKGAGDAKGFGDLDVWGKIIPLRNDFMTLGGGLVVTFPTGESPDFSTDEYGFEPFLTAGFAAGPVQIRTSAGYDVFTDTDDYDGLDYNAAILAPIGDIVAVRAEFAGFHYCDSHDDPVAFIPGVDIRLPMGSAEFVIRPTGLVGVTGDAPDWGVGLSLAFTGIGG